MCTNLFVMKDIDPTTGISRCYGPKDQVEACGFKPSDDDILYCNALVVADRKLWVMKVAACPDIDIPF